MGPGSAAHHFALRSVRGTRARFRRTSISTPSLPAKRSNPECLCGVVWTASSQALLAMTERGWQLVGWVERSETHQHFLRGKMMGFAALYPSYAPRTHAFASSRLISPELCLDASPSMKEGAGKAGCRPGTHGPLCGRWQQEFAQRHTGEAKHPAFPAQWLYGLCRALPGERCTIAPVVPRDD